MTITPSQVASKSVFETTATYQAIAHDVHSGRLYAAGSDGAVHVFDSRGESKTPFLSLVRHENYVSTLVLAPAGPTEPGLPPLAPLLVSGGYDGKLIWWDVRSGTAIRVVAAHRGWVRQAVLLPDGKRLASVGDDMQVRLWNVATGESLGTFGGHATRTPQGHVMALYALTAAPDGKYLASGDRVGVVRIWEVDTGRLERSLAAPTLYTYDPRQRKRSIGGIRSLAFSPSGDWLAVGGIGQIDNVDGFAGPAHVEIWDWRMGKTLATGDAQGHKAILQRLAFTPDGEWLIGAGGGEDDGLLAFWNTKRPLPDDPSGVAKLTAEKVKYNGHVHDFSIDAGANELHAAGHRKLETWRLG